MEAGWFILNNEKPQKTVFLDRDGVINKCAAPHCYISKWEEFEFFPSAIQGIKRLNAAGYLVLLITNQRGIARGLLSMQEVEELHQKMCEHLKRQGANIDGIYICPHDNGECYCRKPDIGLFLQAEKEWQIDKEHSWMIGDSNTDVEAGKRYGVRTILLSDIKEDYGQNYTFSDLKTATAFLTDEIKTAYAVE